jgi:CBS domain-containing membrane protein
LPSVKPRTTRLQMASEHPKSDHPKTVGELMTRKVVTVGEDDTLGAAGEGMERFHFRHLPVIKDGKLVGLVTHRDLLHASSSFLSEQAEARDALIKKQPIKRIMRTELVTVEAQEPLLDAARLMLEAKIGCLPVIDADEKLVGIVTEADFLKLTVRLLGGAATPPPPPSSIGHR